MTDEPDISAAFPFQSKYTDIYGSAMHYVDEGSGDPMLFLHGNPTSSYLWRNIIPHLASHARCVAPDLIGMGKSGKPHLDYRFGDHAKYLDAFIAKMGLNNMTLVLHDWGSALGFHYARRHPERIKGITFMEAILGTARWSDFPPKFQLGFKLFRAPGLGWLMLSGMNLFVEQVLPQATIRSLNEAEMNHYRAPYRSIKSRKPVQVWPQEMPINGKPEDVHQLVTSYNRWLRQTDIPKLLFYAHPGGILRSEQIEWCRENLLNLDTVDVGKGIHYLQEDHPHKIGRELAEWYGKLS